MDKRDIGIGLVGLVGIAYVVSNGVMLADFIKGRKYKPSEGESFEADETVCLMCGDYKDPKKAYCCNDCSQYAGRAVRAGLRKGGSRGAGFTRRDIAKAVQTLKEYGGEMSANQWVARIRDVRPTQKQLMVQHMNKLVGYLNPDIYIKTPGKVITYQITGGNCYDDWAKERYQAESFDAELKRDSCCCGATVETPCLCMVEGVMECSASEPKCPCYAAKDAESFEAEDCHICGKTDEELVLFGKKGFEQKICISCKEWHYPDGEYGVGVLGAESYDAEDLAYGILDNGGQPFLVKVSKNNVEIYQDGMDSDGNWGNYPKLIKKYKPLKTFIGKSLLNPTTSFSGGYGAKFDGNSILLKIGRDKYVYIGSTIYEFSTDGDEIVKYYSPVGNSSVPYPFAYGKKNVYLMLGEGRTLKEKGGRYFSYENAPTHQNKKSTDLDWEHYYGLDKKYYKKMKNVKSIWSQMDRMEGFGADELEAESFEAEEDCRVCGIEVIGDDTKDNNVGIECGYMINGEEGPDCAYLLCNSCLPSMEGKPCPDCGIEIPDEGDDDYGAESFEAPGEMEEEDFTPMDITQCHVCARPYEYSRIARALVQHYLKESKDGTRGWKTKGNPDGTRRTVRNIAGYQLYWFGLGALENYLEEGKISKMTPMVIELLRTAIVPNIIAGDVVQFIESMEIDDIEDTDPKFFTDFSDTWEAPDDRLRPERPSDDSWDRRKPRRKPKKPWNAETEPSE